MFTGIITDVGQIRLVERSGDTRVVIETAYDTSAVAMGASIACAGVCLTVVDKGEGWFAADVSDETLRCTAVGDWQAGKSINLERSLKLGDEMGGHIVTGHVDCVGVIAALTPENDSLTMDITVPKDFGHLLVAKGSAAINGTSLTVNTVQDSIEGTTLSINLIPHTQSVTSFHTVSLGERVNVEFDILARYVARLQDTAFKG